MSPPSPDRGGTLQTHSSRFHEQHLRDPDLWSMSPPPRVPSLLTSCAMLAPLLRHQSLQMACTHARNHFLLVRDHSCDHRPYSVGGGVLRSALVVLLLWRHLGPNGDLPHKTPSLRRVCRNISVVLCRLVMRKCHLCRGEYQKHLASSMRSFCRATRKHSVMDSVGLECPPATTAPSLLISSWWPFLPEKWCWRPQRASYTLACSQEHHHLEGSTHSGTSSAQAATAFPERKRRRIKSQQTSTH